ncbi:MAG: DUF1615 family protein [Acinetobacter sp.]|nr:MAG: DUF1615 family protein [Acinetobacter sp.]
MNSYHHIRFSCLMAFSLLTISCDGQLTMPQEKTLSIEQIAKLIPSRVKERSSWANDIVQISQQLKIEKNAENMCTIIAVVDQESNFVADPVVAGLGEKAIREINERLEKKLGKQMANYFENMLKTRPTPENNYLSQIRKVKTERELDQLYREMFDYYSKQYHVSLLAGAAKLAGQDIAEQFNPITTLGSMQVHIRYAKANKRSFINIHNLRDDMYTQNGGLYYGIHRLMMYPVQYDKPLYRFADYNSGMYSSRNAAFQKMLNTLANEQLDLDGDLLLYNKDGDVKLQKSGTEITLIQYFSTDPTAPPARTIRSDLKQEKTQDFEDTTTYQYVVKHYEKQTGQEAPYAIMPKVIISGPKLSRDYNTNWFASRVNGRYLRCMSQAKRLKLN